MINGVEDFLEQAERVVGRVQRVKQAYKKGKTKNQAPEIVHAPPIDLDRTMKLYLAAGAVALVGWFVLVKR